MAENEGADPTLQLLKELARAPELPIDPTPRMAVGAHVDRYEILGLLGEGGMGAVYRARDTRLGREIALKLLRDDPSADHLRRLEHEARALAQLSHPNIVVIHDFGSHDGRPFLALELLDGVSLRQYLATGPLAPTHAIALAREMLDGLAAAHQRGIIHRDLKPENLFLVNGGRLKILDFGLAKRMAAGDEASLRTQAGLVLGTASYMAPEQVRGGAVDARTDLFAVGAVLWELLSGRRAFVAPSAIETMHRILSNAPLPLEELVPDVPAPIAAFIEHCLAKAPENRFPSAQAARAALDAAGAPDATASRRRSRPLGIDARASQRVRYLRAADGVRIAWAESGSGPPLVKASNWLTHLEFEWESPVWRHWIRFLSDHFRYVRFDERGCGMSEWTVGDASIEQWLADLESVVDAAGLTEPFSLLGISQGAATAVAYAVAHPERVSGLLLCGGYARGVARRETPDAERLYRALVDMIRLGWGTENPAFRQVFTSRFIPGGTDEQLSWFNDLCRKTTSPEVAADLCASRADVDVRALLPKVKAPTLILHAREDALTPIAESRILAAEIPGAEFVELDSKNHVLLEHEPAWQRFCEAVLDFKSVAWRAS